MLNSVTTSKSADALLELSESALSAAIGEFTSNDLLKEIPIIGGVVGIASGVLAFRERRYVSKLLRVLSETAKASEKDKERFRQKLDASPEEAKKAGATVLDVVDKITSNDKAEMIGKLLRAYMHESDLSLDRLMSLCEIIERAYLQDLKSLERGGGYNDVHLENLGVKKPMRVEDINDVIEKAVNQAVEEATSQAGVVKETFTAEPTEGKKVVAQVKQSGFTELGSNLRRILSTYE